MTKPETDTNLIATKLAAETSAKAAELATATAATAVALATKTAETTSVISNDISWMKKSLAGIETKLDQMDKAFVTAAQHAEVLKELSDHETRITTLDTEKTRTTVLLSIVIGIGTLLATLMIYHLIGR